MFGKKSQTAQKSGLFSGISDARTSVREPYFPPGIEAKVEVVEVDCYESRDPKHKGSHFFKVRARIDEVRYDAASPPETPIRNGMTCVQIINLAHGEPALADVKMFCTAVYRSMAISQGTKPEEVGGIDERAVEALLDPSQPGAGVKIGLRTIPKTTKAGGAYTLHVYDDSEAFHFSFDQIVKNAPVAPVAPVTDDA
jgi:hypothetical protein